jgi:rare lipoprotein A
MHRVSSALPFGISPATLTAALVVAAGWIAGALFVAHHIASLEQPSLKPSAAALPEPAPELSQTPNRAAKAAREPFRQAALAPDPSRPPQDDPSRAASRPPQDEASSLDASRRPQDDEVGARAQTGRASWYDIAARTASGEAMDGDALTAAHRTLPFGSKVRVANLANGRSVVVRINDRGPFAKGRVIDVSRAAAERLGMIRSGVARVSVTPVDEAVASDEVASASAE